MSSEVEERVRLACSFVAEKPWMSPCVISNRPTLKLKNIPRWLC